MIRLRTLLLLCVLFALSSARMASAQVPSEGRDFYLAYIHPTYNDYVAAGTGAYFKVFAYVSSFNDNYVEVSYFDPATKKEEYPVRYKIPARRTVPIPLDIARMRMKEPGDLPNEFTSCHLKSKGPINVQFFTSGANSGGSYLALPVNAWGKEYVIQSYHDNGSQSGFMPGGRSSTTFDENGGAFVVVAGYDGTKVTIIPAAQTGSGKTGVRSGPGATGIPRPYTVNLNRGQCWYVTSRSVKLGNDDDISGSIVKADKPVGVISGNQDAYVDGSDVYDFRVEQRDYMVEQLIPVEFWDHKGYISIPMMESGTARDGFGEENRIYVTDANVPSVVHADLGTFQPYDLFPGTYIPPASKIFEVPVHYYADSGTKFSVSQVDLRSHGTSRTTPPLPSPSMSNIVPKSSWRNAYLWYVPANVNERLQAYYITIIAPKDNAEIYYEPKDTLLKRAWYQDSLRVSVNGTKEVSTSVFGAPQRTFNNIPGHPELKAVTYKVAPNTSYYAHAPYKFMIYHFGMRAVDVDGDLGDFDDEDMFFSYYLPLGMSLQTGVKRMSVTVDTLCTGWRVCVHDSNENVGIKSVTLLDDPNGDIVIGGNYQYKNVRFDPSDDPLNLKEITKAPPPKNLCFNLLVENPGADAYAPLYIIDANGNSMIVELRYKRQAVEFYPPDSVGLVFKKWDANLRKMDIPYVGEDTCMEYIFVNQPSSPRSYIITKVDIPQPSPFRILSTTPSVGASINPGDTLRMMVCFTGPDTLLQFDSIEFETDCFPALLPVQGQAGAPIIVAEDEDFGNILVNTTFCKDVEVKNTGNKALTLDENWFRDNVTEFFFDTTQPGNPKNKLPVIIMPGKSHVFRFCYSPLDEGRDSARQDWGNDTRDPYKNHDKPFSILTGGGILPGVNWDRAVEDFHVTCDSEVVERVNLFSIGTADAELTRIWIDGPDAAEFRVVITEFNWNPPTFEGTNVAINDTMWVDVRFKADLSKGYIPRTAFLRTSSKLDSGKVKTIALTGYVHHAVATPTVDIAPNTMDFTYIVAGTRECRALTIKNDGDAPLVISGYVATGRPFVSITSQGKDLSTLLPMTIDTGASEAFEICGTMDTWGDTTVPITFQFNDAPCTPEMVILQHYSSTNNVVTVAIPPHPPTYVGGCRDTVVDGEVVNRGFAVDVTLEQVRIINGGPGLNNANEFKFAANGLDIITGINKVMRPNDREAFPVIYSPVTIGNTGAILEATWDSAGKKFTGTAEIHGRGVQLLNTFSVEKADGGNFTARTNEFITVPARFKDNITTQGAPPAGAMGATFTVVWKGDQFNFVDAEDRGRFRVNPPVDGSDVIRNADGTEQVTIHVTSNSGEVTIAEDLADLNFQVMLNKSTSTEIMITNGVFTDAAGTPLCYFVNQHIPGQFVQEDNCGDGTLRDWLSGNKPTSISYLTPNPAVPGSQLTLGYAVHMPDALVTVELFDVKGEKVRSLQVDKITAEGDHTLMVDTDGLAAGAYTVRLSSSNWSETTGFVIEK